jgi:hypothetical protein
MGNKSKTNPIAGDKEYFLVRAFIGYDDRGNHVYRNFYGTSKLDAKLRKNNIGKTFNQVSSKIKKPYFD